MPKKYEIQTMKKDIEKLAKKVSLPAGKAGLPTDKDKIPDNLPMAPASPSLGGPASTRPSLGGPASPSLGGPLPSEPIATLSPIPPKPKQKLEPPKPREEKHKKFGPYKIIKEKLNKKSIAIIIGIAIIILIAAGMYYWWNYMHKSDSSESPETEIPIDTPADTTLKIPDSIFELDEIKEIESLGINVPNNVSSVLKEEYTFFSYVEQGRNRVGFIVEVIDYEVLKTSLRDWEYTILEDLRLMFSGQEFSKPLIIDFQDNIYLPAGKAGNEVELRYINLPDSSLSIDYAILDKYLVITTSKESMYGVIDRILGE